MAQGMIERFMGHDDRRAGAVAVAGHNIETATVLIIAGVETKGTIETKFDVAPGLEQAEWDEIESFIAGGGGAASRLDNAKEVAAVFLASAETGPNNDGWGASDYGTPNLIRAVFRAAPFNMTMPDQTPG